MKTKKLFYGINRYGEQIWFTHKADNWYEIHSTEDGFLDYITSTFTDVDEDAEDYDVIYTHRDGSTQKAFYYSIDPSGGPYMAVGKFTIDGKKLVRVKNIDNTLLFKFIDIEVE